MANEHDNQMPFTRTNYRLLLIGLGILVVGYTLMSGGGSGEHNVLNAE